MKEEFFRLRKVTTTTIAPALVGMIPQEQPPLPPLDRGVTAPPLDRGVTATPLDRGVTAMPPDKGGGKKKAPLTRGVGGFTSRGLGVRRGVGSEKGTIC